MLDNLHPVANKKAAPGCLKNLLNSREKIMEIIVMLMLHSLTAIMLIAPAPTIPYATKGNSVFMPFCQKWLIKREVQIFHTGGRSQGNKKEQRLIAKNPCIIRKKKF